MCFLELLPWISKVASGYQELLWKSHKSFTLKRHSKTLDVQVLNEIFHGWMVIFLVSVQLVIQFEPFHFPSSMLTVMIWGLWSSFICFACLSLIGGIDGNSSDVCYVHKLWTKWGKRLCRNLHVIPENHNPNLCSGVFFSQSTDHNHCECLPMLSSSCWWRVWRLRLFWVSISS